MLVCFMRSCCVYPPTPQLPDLTEEAETVSQKSANVALLSDPARSRRSGLQHIERI